MDPVTVAVGIGLAVSLLLTEVFGLAAGGMVVPGYLALFLDRPLVVALTLAAALLTWGAARALSRVIVIYGKRRTALMIITGFLIGWAIRSVDVALNSGAAAGGMPAPADFAVIGYIIPGLIAIWIDRQGPVETCCTVLTAGAVVRLVLMTCGMEGVA
jgi:poly-gamma-glutamate biosynthesis protein PgsC/CapC